MSLVSSQQPQSWEQHLAWEKYCQKFQKFTFGVRPHLESVTLEKLEKLKAPVIVLAGAAAAATTKSV